MPEIDSGLVAVLKVKPPARLTEAVILLIAPAAPRELREAPLAKTKLLALVELMVVVPVPEVSPNERVARPFAKLAEISPVCDTLPKAPLTVATSPAAEPGVPVEGFQLAEVFQSSVPAPGTIV